MRRRCLDTSRPKRWRVSSRRRRPPLKDSNGSSAGATGIARPGPWRASPSCPPAPMSPLACSSCGHSNVPPLRDREDPIFQTGEWGFALGSAFWGSGLFLDAARLVLDFAFDYRRAAARSARGGGERARQRRAAQDGAVQEGVLRRSFHRGGQFHDQVLWSILAEDWRLQQGPQLGPLGFATDIARVGSGIQDARAFSARAPACARLPGDRGEATLYGCVLTRSISTCLPNSSPRSLPSSAAPRASSGWDGRTAPYTSRPFAGPARHCSSPGDVLVVNDTRVFPARRNRPRACPAVARPSASWSGRGEGEQCRPGGAGASGPEVETGERMRFERAADVVGGEVRRPPFSWAPRVRLWTRMVRRSRRHRCASGTCRCRRISSATIGRATASATRRCRAVARIDCGAHRGPALHARVFRGARRRAASSSAASRCTSATAPSNRCASTGRGAPMSIPSATRSRRGRRSASTRALPEGRRIIAVGTTTTRDARVAGRSRGRRGSARARRRRALHPPGHRSASCPGWSRTSTCRARRC